ncbi:GNAT family protein [Paenibacillus sp. FSL H8-0537]|uniref:GNAT family N-acetyltransferase n=1 Tax=Paenibacillus sp. FSL H8-0537 TaxID=2921399 RepID=UPI003100CB52
MKEAFLAPKVPLFLFGFEELDLHKIHAAAMSKNPASSSVMKKVGMKYEGTFLQHYLKWDNYEDIDYYGLLREDYLNGLKAQP